MRRAALPGRVVGLAGRAGLAALAGLAGLGGLPACGSVQPDPTASLARQAAQSTASTTSTSSTPAPATPTTVDPGSLAQTADLPTTSGPDFNARVQALWQAIVDGTPDEALPFFFPRSAYLQVKAIRDPGADWQTRLIAHFDQDIVTLHRALGTTQATLLGIDVPANAVWIRPGVEFNRLSYWRVYGTEVRYQVAGATHRFAIASMISWRGEWYVVHLSSIR